MTEGDAFIRAFLRGNQHHLTLLDGIDVEALLLRPRLGARSIGEIFAHICQTRVDWIEQGGGASHLEGHEPLAPGDEESRDNLKAALESTASAMASFLGERLLAGGQTAESAEMVGVIVASLIAHDAHHRGQILAHLAQADITIDKGMPRSLWDWA